MDPILWAGVGSHEAVGGDTASGGSLVAGDTGAETALRTGLEADPLAEAAKAKDGTANEVASLADGTARGNTDERKNEPTVIPSVLEPLEVERMMGFLEGVDDGVRRKVCSLASPVIHMHPLTGADVFSLYNRHFESSTPSTPPSSPLTSHKQPLYFPPLVHPHPRLLTLHNPT